MRRVLTIGACCVALSAAAVEPAGAAFGVLGEWGSEGAANGQFANPRATAVDANGVYVADTFNNRIQRFTAAGAFVSAWGSGGGGPSQFNFPEGIATGSGSVYVADTLNNRIQRFSPTGAFLGAFGTFGFESGEFNSPQGLTTDAAGNLYVADASNSRIQVFSPAGVHLRDFGSDGSGPGQLETPAAVAVDSAGNAYVADTFNHRVQKFDSAGAFVGGWGSQGAGPGQFSSPYGIAVGPGGVVYVADAGNARIQAFTSAGAFISSFGSFGGPRLGSTCPALFNFPRGLSTSAAGNLYVADESNDRIQRFGEGGFPLGCSAVLGRSVTVQAVKGQVLVALPAKSARASAAVPGLKGKNFVPVSGLRQLPVGSFLDTRKGTVRLTSARNTAGKTQTGDFTAGVFQVLQSRKRSAKGLTELRLKGSSFKRCTARRSGRAQAAGRRRLSKRAIRRLRSKATGRFRTRGRHSSATVRGTSWTTTDRCDGTLTKVTRGRVDVRDFRRKKTIRLRRGKSYLARARR